MPDNNNSYNQVRDVALAALLEHSQQLPPQRPKPRGKRMLGIAIILAVLLAVGGTSCGLLNHFAPGVLQTLGLRPGPLDYSGDGEGEAQITVRSGYSGYDIAKELYAAGVIGSVEAFNTYVHKQHPDAIFDIGTYALRKKMSVAAAFAALQDSANKIQLRVTILEGLIAEWIFARLAEKTGIPVADFTAAAQNYVQLGVPSSFSSIEGFLFPATYDFVPDDTAESILRKLVDRMWQALREHGVAAKDAHTVLTKAALVQRESGSNPADKGKIARVFENRLRAGMPLQSDATVTYGTGKYDSVFTTDADRADTNNPYNTYAHPGLPAGPIGSPGDDAIAAVLNPTPGPWLYFVPINLETGETVFSETYAEHERGVAQLQAWCKAHSNAGGKLCG